MVRWGACKGPAHSGFPCIFDFKGFDQPARSAVALLPGRMTKAPGPTALWTQSDPKSPQAEVRLWDFPPLEPWGLEALLPQPGSFSHGTELGQGPHVLIPAPLQTVHACLRASVSQCASQKWHAGSSVGHGYGAAALPVARPRMPTQGPEDSVSGTALLHCRVRPAADGRGISARSTTAPRRGCTGKWSRHGAQNSPKNKAPGS